MTRFLKLKERSHINCMGCVFLKFSHGCQAHRKLAFPFCGESIYISVPRPHDGTRCRDRDGNIKVVGVDV